MKAKTRAPRDPARPPRGWDFFLSVFLIFILLVLTGIFVVAGFGMGLTTITCADSAESCNYDFISIGTLLSIVGTSLVAVIGIITSVVFIARRRVSFVIPLVSCLVVVGLFFIGSWLVDIAVPGA
jgi:hypothetical protein